MATSTNWRRYEHKLHVQAQAHAAQGLVKLPKDDNIGMRDYTFCLYSDSQEPITQTGDASFIFELIHEFELSYSISSMDPSCYDVGNTIISLSDIGDKEIWFRIDAFTMISIVENSIEEPIWSKCAKSEHSTVVCSKYVLPVYESTLSYIQESGDWVSQV